MTSNNRILTDAELNGVSGGLTNGDNPFVQAVMNAYNTYDNPNAAIDPRCGSFRHRFHGCSHQASAVAK